MRFNLSMVFSTTFGHVHTSYVVYVHEGKCIDLVGCPIRGGQAWLKNLSIFEWILRRFNWSMVFGTAYGHVHSSYDTGNSITVTECTLY